MRKWRGRFAELRMAGLKDLSRSGRPGLIPEADRAAVVAPACQLPRGHRGAAVALDRAGARGRAPRAGPGQQPVSASSVLRILAENPVKPWRYQSWIFPRDPDLEAKAKVVLDLYQGFYQGESLQPGDRILSVDAKPSIQARARVHATLPATPGRTARVEHEYDGNGALALLAGLDVHTGTVLLVYPRQHGIVPFMDLVGQVMTRPEYKRTPRGCSSSWTTDRTTAGRRPPTGSAKPTPTPS